MVGSGALEERGLGGGEGGVAVWITTLIGDWRAGSWLKPPGIVSADAGEAVGEVVYGGAAED